MMRTYTTYKDGSHVHATYRHRARRSHSQEVDAELRAAAAVGVHHVERLRVPGAHHALEPRPHVHQVALRRAGAGDGAGDVVVREHAGAHGHRLHRAQHPPLVRAAVPAHREPALAAVAVRAPRWLLQQAPPLLPCTHAWMDAFSFQ
uniref:Uncharacterized protein n=1 Tax=Zea mays TaxID=4577 RepID=A0A804NV57_MAIZE